METLKEDFKNYVPEVFEFPATYGPYSMSTGQVLLIWLLAFQGCAVYETLSGAGMSALKYLRTLHLALELLDWYSTENHLCMTAQRNYLFFLRNKE